MEFLVPDLLFEIFGYCKLRDLVSLKRVNKKYHKLIIENYQSYPYLIKINQNDLEISSNQDFSLIIYNIDDLVVYNYSAFVHLLLDLNNRKIENLKHEFLVGFSGDDLLFLRTENDSLIISYTNTFKTKIIQKKNLLEIFRLFCLIFNFCYDDLSCMIYDSELDQEICFKDIRYPIKWNQTD